jgi:predicted phosphodiesterase|tara:strand:- start:2001 stop:2711 length:711 start_codon:yes stop_codon:yes gene_type:complete
MNTKRLLILSDTHFPYQMPGYFEWIKKLRDKIKPTQVIHIGDLVDFHAISQHLHSAELPNIKYEIKDAIRCIKKLRKIFPAAMPIIYGNHDIRIQRLAEKSAIPNSFLRHINDILEIEKKWKWTWHDKLIVELPNKTKVFFTHHFKSNVVASAKELGMSYVAGHQHTLSQLTLISSPLALNFAMCVGCSINPKHEAFKYAKNYIKRPIISVGAIINSQPVIYAMPLNDKGEWTGTI